MSSTISVPLRANLVSRTIPPSSGADIALCMVLRVKSDSFLPESIVTDTAAVTTPRPPICMSASITACPKPDQLVAVSLTTSPVTHDAETAVKIESPNGAHRPSREDMGSIKRTVPMSITPAKPSMITIHGDILRLFSNISSIKPSFSLLLS